MDRQFLQASSIEEALKLKDGSSVFFAGGTEIEHLSSRVKSERFILLPKTQTLTDISIKDGFIRIGALVTFTRALGSSYVPDYLKGALRFCGSFQKRNMATVCGNIASWRSDSYLIPTFIAAGASLELGQKDAEPRIVNIREYADRRDSFKDALIISVIIPAAVRVISKRFSNTVESHAYLTIAMGRGKTMTDGYGEASPDWKEDVLKTDNDEYRIGLAIKNSGIFMPDILSWSVTWKKADVRDDMFGTEEYKRYLTGITLDDMYEKLLGEGGKTA